MGELINVKFCKLQLFQLTKYCRCHVIFNTEGAKNFLQRLFWHAISEKTLSRILFCNLKNPPVPAVKMYGSRTVAHLADAHVRPQRPRLHQFAALLARQRRVRGSTVVRNEVAVKVGLGDRGVPAPRKLTRKGPDVVRDAPAVFADEMVQEASENVEEAATGRLSGKVGAGIVHRTLLLAHRTGQNPTKVIRLDVPRGDVIPQCRRGRKSFPRSFTEETAEFEEQRGRDTTSSAASMARLPLMGLVRSPGQRNKAASRFFAGKGLDIRRYRRAVYAYGVIQPACNLFPNLEAAPQSRRWDRKLCRTPVAGYMRLGSTRRICDDMIPPQMVCTLFRARKR